MQKFDLILLKFSSTKHSIAPFPTNPFFTINASAALAYGFFQSVAKIPLSLF